MLEQPETTETSWFEPPVSSHKPASGKSQVITGNKSQQPFHPESLCYEHDISHVLASTFKDLYTKDIIGKDTLSNLIQTNNGRSSYHDKYVAELQQVINLTLTMHHCTVCLIMLCARRTIKIISIFIIIITILIKSLRFILNTPIKSEFFWCVDKDLLEVNNLISPQAYLRTEKPRMKPPKPNLTKPRPKWKDEPSTKDWALEMDKLQKLKDRHNFLRNPRFLPPNAHQGGASLILPRTRVVKTNHERKGMEEQRYLKCTTLELKNLTSSSRHVRVIPPTSPFFSIGLGRFPGDGGVVAPGMSCKYTVRFAPDSLADYDDFIVVESQAEHLFVVPIAARRPPPILSLPRVLDCGYCLIGGVKFVEFLCQNFGLSPGTFCIIPKNQWPSVARTYFSEQPPFAVSPSVFVLQPEEATVVEVVFFPTTAEKSRQVFTVVCDNCQVKDITIEGEGHLIALELVSVSGEKKPPVISDVHDLTAEHCVHFNPCNPHSAQQKTLIIRNNVHLELPFHWRIMVHLATEDVFHISPLTGLLGPCQDHEFLFTFCPKKLYFIHVPSKLFSEAEGLPQRSKVSDVIVMEIEVKGSAEPYQVLLEPYAVVIPGEIFISTTTRRQFKMWNHSKTFIIFQWERMNSTSHIIEVEPSTGRIEENECFDFDLIMTGGKPERVVTALVCHIKHHHEPVTLAVEVSFKVNISINTFTKLLTVLVAQNLQFPKKEFLVTLYFEYSFSKKPCRGVLPPLASCSVNVLFKPRFCQHFETELELRVENGTGCHLSVQADVQSPQVCLLNCELLLSELYIGVPAKSTVTLFNQTLMPSHFRWMLQGKQASLCTASFDPSSGTLGPNASLEITLEVAELAARCEIQGMASPLVLGISASKTKKLCVSYSFSNPDDKSPSTLVLDFGNDVVLKRAVTKQLLMTNLTPVTAPFTIEAEYFSCHAFKPSNQSEKRHLLAHGKGAAFFVLPSTGVLGPFETQTVDVTAYTDMWGEYKDHLICKVGDLEPTLLPMQMTVTGCPLFFQMTGPQPDDQNQGPTVQFGTQVSGGDTVSRSFRINNPTMVDIRMDWETYNIDKNDHKLVDMVVTYGEAFPVKDADGNEVMSGPLRLSDRNIQTTWKTSQTLSDSLQSMTKKLFSVHIRPHVGNLSDYPYCITPQQIVIPAKSSSTIHVSFTPLTLSGSASESRCVGLALGFMSLDSEFAACVPGKVVRAQGLDLEPVRMDLLATVKPAGCTVFLMSHAQWSLCFDLQLTLQDFNITKSLQLKNTSEMPLRFRLGTQPPFTVLKPQFLAQTGTSNNLPTGNSQSLVLHPQHSMQIKVAFHCSLLLLDHVDQKDEELPLGVTMIHSACGQRKLRFEQNLLIHYSNNSLQVRDGSKSQVEVLGIHCIFLCTESDERDSLVFRVTPDSGLLKSKELHVSSCSRCLEISFTPR
uniref:DLEC1 cilia and flagella associated protein n=1 Tax=Mastacembelus armatus TaxID=205130 RepID=A0A3Q3L0I4_9TELE